MKSIARFVVELFQKLCFEQILSPIRGVDYLVSIGLESCLQRQIFSARDLLRMLKSAEPALDPIRLVHHSSVQPVQG